MRGSVLQMFLHSCFWRMPRFVAQPIVWRYLFERNDWDVDDKEKPYIQDPRGQPLTLSRAGQG
jgi:hypothetical protein